MDSLRESFLKTYANTPINLRGDIILVLDKLGPVSWNAAYIEVEKKSEISETILKELKSLDLI
jgi:hypothetical protein